ncbi:GNAT family N-acetyltransferase [Streptomyces fructofermentans]|uniref:GNAT family N-acetyltransferase n=1 Tax=Streptomyces fructofermentans TaxID=152141 RepID=UPI0037B77DA9
MRFEWDFLHPVMRVPYVPTIGPVHPDALAAGLFEDIVRVAGTGDFLPYDKDRRWSPVKDESVLPEHITHTSVRTLIPTLRPRGAGTLNVYAYGAGLEEAADLATKLAADCRTSTARVVTFHRPDKPPPAGAAATRIQLREFGHARPDDHAGRILPVDSLPTPVRVTFGEFAERLTSDGFAFLHTQMQAGTVGPVLVATDGPQVVGAIGPMETMTDSARRTRLLPQYFGVLPEHRGRGHGRALWRAAMAWGSANGADYQLLQTEIGGASDRLCQAEGLRSLGFVATAKL